MAEELIPVNIIVGDRSYRIKALASDEEHIRKTLKVINDKIVEFKTNFAGKDMQDYIAMVLVWYATQSAAEGRNLGQEQELEEMLLKMEKAMEVVSRKS
jgi:cell division protein ZapA (FtsZ GTPase activity inhibitor)